MTILAFDTSGPFVSVALATDGRVISESFAEMARGQAEALMPMIADLMAEAGIRRSDIAAVAVGTGPGNFTGLRIAVSAARGLALALGRPALGVSGFEALVEDVSGLCLASLPAPREQVYLQMLRDGQPEGEAWLSGLDDITAEPTPDVVIGHTADRIAACLGTSGAPAELVRPAAAIARIATRKLAVSAEHPRPAPLYVRPADAAPSRDGAPVILP
ncbi:tRNA (adenosine(37)-N6)-threonylcarbamoyltransferase complex dimerization subunit type 1 TsaB [Rhodobacterales bacterium HKCCE3408]|nr:tRNA (adenosine(37)-N6)-threonylcarbamoyltransferase complex dimerization subunit type 1 TsaB [Rhodobacterales bacterium HKCCE3408]